MERLPGQLRILLVVSIDCIDLVFVPLPSTDSKSGKLCCFQNLWSLAKMVDFTILERVRD